VPYLTWNKNLQLQQAVV